MLEVYWRTAPLFVDAYQTNDENTSDLDSVIKKLHESMKDTAKNWGSNSLGEQILRTNEIVRINEKNVFSWGIIEASSLKSKPVTKKYVCIGNNLDELEIIEFDYPSEWDVT